MTLKLVSSPIIPSRYLYERVDVCEFHCGFVALESDMLSLELDDGMSTEGMLAIMMMEMMMMIMMEMMMIMMMMMMRMVMIIVMMMVMIMMLIMISIPPLHPT
jgi:hypothetical protein